MSSTAAWCERAAALCEAGLSHARIESVIGAPPVDADTDGAIALVWRLSRDMGIRPVTLLSRCAESAREWDRIRGDRRAAVAGPKLAARVILAMPVAALVMGSLLGVNPFGFLLSNPLGWACIGVGALSLWLAARWMRRLIDVAERAEPAPGFACELIAGLLESGLPLLRAVDIVHREWANHESVARDVVALSKTIGLPPVLVLQAEAHAQRDEAAADARQRCAELGVRLTLPLGACVLPAFLAWGVVPIVCSLVRAVTVP